MDRPTLTQQQIRERYNNQAEQYQTRYVGVKGEYYSRFEDRIFLEFLATPLGRVLDLGTGRGRLPLLLADRAREVFGIDLSDEMIRHAKEAAAEHPHLHFERGDASNLHFDDGYFDAVASMGMFPYVKDVFPLFREINRVLAPGGVFVFSACNAREWLWSYRAYLQVHRFRRWLRGAPEPATPAPESPLIPHDLRFLAQELERAGFHLEAYRTTFWFLPSRAFYLAGRHRVRTLQHAAATANDALGRFPWIKDHGKVLIVCARKRRG